MRIITLILLAMLLCAGAYADDSNVINLDVGNIHFPYFYPEMNLGFQSASLFGLSGLRVSAEIRSFGTLYLYNPGSYNFNARVTYDHPLSANATSFFGGGAEYRLRLFAYQPPGGFEPVGTLGLDLRLQPITIRAGLDLRFYSDGISIMLQPEIGWRWAWFGLFLRDEIECLVRYSNGQTGWNWNTFLSTRYFLH